jgi:hypothetical protein
LGEEGDYRYARWLADEHPDWDIVATSYAPGRNNQLIQPELGGRNLTVVTDVDATRLHEGSFTSMRKFDDIVFNGPRAEGRIHPRGRHRDLVVETLESSRYVLKQGGTVRISSSTNMPAGHFLNGLTTGNPKSVPHLPSGFLFRGGRGAPTKGRPAYPFLGDKDFGWPDYRPISNEGDYLDISPDEIHWYMFTLSE